MIGEDAVEMDESAVPIVRLAENEHSLSGATVSAKNGNQDAKKNNAGHQLLPPKAKPRSAVDEQKKQGDSLVVVIIIIMC